MGKSHTTMSLSESPTLNATKDVNHVGERSQENFQGCRQSREDDGYPQDNARSEEEEIENPQRPKGAKFAILFLCILLGDFFVGYVRLVSQPG